MFSKSCTEKQILASPMSTNYKKSNQCSEKRVNMIALQS